jgi:hypothetical protein
VEGQTVGGVDELEGVSKLQRQGVSLFIYGQARNEARLYGAALTASHRIRQAYGD